MKTIYSMQEFYEKVKEVAISAGKSYISIAVEMSNNKEILFRCYVGGFGLHVAPTMEGAIRELRNVINKPAIPDIDVEIEVDAIPETGTFIYDPQSGYQI